MTGLGKLLGLARKEGDGKEEKDGAATPKEAPSANSSASKKRTRHPKEIPFIARDDWGKLRFDLAKGSKQIIGEKNRPLLWEDLYKHMGVVGGSGSGKTFTVLNQVFRELFRATHIPDGPDREKLKPGGLIIEAKGDFPEKLWTLSKLYGRMDDTIFFGPTHPVSYDPFRDPTEDPTMRANKMLTLMLALNDGQRSADPFFDKAALELFTNIFCMHQKLTEAKVEGVQAMSFSYLGMMLSDRGNPKNLDEVTASRNAEEAAARAYENNVPKWLDETNAVMERVNALRFRLQEIEGVAREILDREQAVAQKKVETTLSAAERIWRKRLAIRARTLHRQTEEALTTPRPNYDEQPPTSLIEDLEIFQKNAHGFLVEHPDFEPSTVVPLLANLGDRIRPQLERILAAGEEIRGLLDEASHRDPKEGPFPLVPFFREVLNTFDGVRSSLETWGRMCTDQDNAALRWANILKKKVTPKYGLLKTLLEKYEKVLRDEAQARGEDPSPDPVAEYFTGTYLNVANDRTSGSVAMTATNMVGLLSKAPFNQLFSCNPTFDILDIFQKGKLLCLDMPFAFYRDSARLAAVLLKMDYFRATVARQALGLQMERPVFYLVDEFATVATNGDWTGEAAFFDKCRGSKCACIIAFQSLPMLSKKFSQAEVDAIMTNMQTLIYMRNDDPTTNERASKSSGVYQRAMGGLKGGAGEFAFNTNRSFGAEAFSITFSVDQKIPAPVFRTFKVGECLAVLPPEFGGNYFRRQVTFLGDPLNPLENDGFPMPGGPRVMKREEEPSQPPATQPQP
ncbi:MAG: TraM recognition domain-containing protein [Verrucomicrobium sp.]|nr:TraM recognition domain-containing protein [Verrucomicrobium sp.]